MRRKINESKAIFDEIYNVYKNVKPKCNGLPKPKKKRVKSENKKDKDRAWYWFSRYIRVRDCLKTTKTKHIGICYTCGKVFNFKELQCGHGISGRGNAILLDEDIVKIQDYHCNIGLGGNYEVFVSKLIEEHGLKWYQDKLALKHKTVKCDWKSESEKYREKYNLLMFGKPKKLPWE